MIHRVVKPALGLLFGMLVLSGCFVESRPDPVVYSPGYGYSTVNAPGTVYYSGGYYENRYYQPGYYHPAAPFVSARPVYGQPVYGQPAYRGGEVRGGGYVGPGSVRGTVQVR